MKAIHSQMAKDTAITLVAITVFLLLTTQFASQVLGQETLTVAAEDQTAEKVIREPIHRVPKVARNLIGSATAASLGNPTKSKPATTDNQSSNDTVKTKTPAVLPSAVKTIPQPIAGESTDPAGAKLVAQPASATVEPAPHPLDEAIRIAEEGLVKIRENVKDYSAILVKRERVDGKLQKPEYLQVKIRSEGVDEDGEQIPFSIYMKFIKPQASAGRELIWVNGRNENRICVHEGSGLISLKCFDLDPEGWLAMKGQRYPAHQAGMENLVVKLIEKATRDRAAGLCEVVYRDGVRINGRECSVIEVVHPEQRAPYDFHIAKVYIDKELNLPIRYQAHIWPEAGETKPLLLEEYTYLNVKINQGFTDVDFSPENPLYKFRRR